MSLLKRIFRRVGSAIADFDMICEGDRILVCLSGGKDSWALLHVLEHLRCKAPVNFTLEALKVDYPNTPEENASLAAGCESLGVPFTVLDTEIGKIIDENAIPGKSHCAFCAKLRRGFIYTEAKRRGFEKIALGHHREDANETLLMNMFFSGVMKSMPAIFRNDEDEITVIRPLIRVAEDDIREFVRGSGLPVIHENCLYADDRQRSAMKDLLRELSTHYPHLQESLIAAQGNVVPSHLHDPALCRTEERL
jgi:tRNA 2-thiocytidine biosynthesis protein TtcA